VRRYDLDVGYSPSMSSHGAAPGVAHGLAPGMGDSTRETQHVKQQRVAAYIAQLHTQREHLAAVQDFERHHSDSGMAVLNDDGVDETGGRGELYR
jgi:hypothetical protein